MPLEFVAVGNGTGNVLSGQDTIDLYRQGLVLDRNLLGRTSLSNAASVLQ